MTDYRVYLSTKISAKKLEKGSGIIVIEPDDYTSAQIKSIKAKGYKVLAYLSVGTIEKERPWFNKYKKYRLQRLEDWPNEWYIDVRKAPWIEFLIDRAKSLRKKGFDGLWCDNLDVYEYNKSTAMFNGCRLALKQLQKAAGYIMVNGGSEFFDKAMDKKLNLKEMVNGVTQEEVFSRITDYSGSGKFGVQEKGQHNFYVSYLKRLKKYGIQTFLLEYTRDTAVKKNIESFCKNYQMTGYYISKDVDL